MESSPDIVVNKAEAQKWIERLRNVRVEMDEMGSLLEHIVASAKPSPPSKTMRDKSPERKSLFAKSKEPKQSLFTEQDTTKPWRTYTKTGLRYDIIAESPVTLSMILPPAIYTWFGTYSLEVSETGTAEKWRSYFKANTPADTAKISKCLLKAGFVKQRKITS